MGAALITARACSWLPYASNVIRMMHPETRRRVRAAVDALRDQPHLGRELSDELIGLWRYPVGRLRIVYRFDEHRLGVLFIGPRATIYEDLAVLVRTRRLSEQRRRYAAPAHARAL